MKRRIILSLTAVMLIALFTGCASTSKSTTEKDQEAAEFTKNKNKGIVYLYRPGRMVGAGAQTQIKINGTDAGGTRKGNSDRSC